MKAIRCLAAALVCLAVMPFGGCEKQEEKPSKAALEALKSDADSVTYCALLERRKKSAGGADFDISQKMIWFEGLTKEQKKQEIEKLRSLTGSAE